jgi:hypothetical protein
MIVQIGSERIRQKISELRLDRISQGPNGPRAFRSTKVRISALHTTRPAKRFLADQVRRD